MPRKFLLLVDDETAASAILSRFLCGEGYASLRR